ncbi:MAG TPA: ABC transporter ATP-binding protein [Acidobacteriaceae bacterium]
MSLQIETELLSKRYRKNVALSDVSFSVPAGAVYALVGANGAGKSTLIKLLMNIFPASSGEGIVLGTSLPKIGGKIFESIGYVSENQEMPESMTVGAFLDYVRPFYPRWDRHLETQLVHQFDLPLKRKLKDLSRGMKMKAVLASVLAYRPALIVLDEPFSGLDPLVRDEFIESLLARAAETTIFLSSHDLSEIESFATHVGYLEGGRLLFSEEMATLTARFREVEVTLAEAMTDSAAALLASSVPATWLQTQVTGRVARFVDSQFSAESEQVVAARFPDAVGISVAPMSLRSIFLTIAKAGRASVRTSAGAVA